MAYRTIRCEGGDTRDIDIRYNIWHRLPKNLISITLRDGDEMSYIKKNIQGKEVIGIIIKKQSRAPL